jgi:hypothetical protein
MAEYRGRPTSTLIEMMTAQLFDELTDEECDRVGIDIALDWQMYCKLVVPQCTHHFFLEGYDEEEE